MISEHSTDTRLNTHLFSIYTVWGASCWFQAINYQLYILGIGELDIYVSEYTEVRNHSLAVENRFFIQIMQ